MRRENLNVVRLVLNIFIVIGFSILFACPITADAKGRAVLKITIKDTYQTQIRNVMYEEFEEEVGIYAGFYLDKELFILRDEYNDSISLKVEVLDDQLILADTLEYSDRLSLPTRDNYLDLGIFFQYNDPLLGVTQTDVGDAEIFTLKGSVDSLCVATTSKGFNPSKGNYIRIYSLLNHDCDGFGLEPSMPKVEAKIRILNAKGKYVYQKTYKNVLYNEFIDLKWDGKASKGNNAGVKSGKYVSAGKYYVEVSETISALGYKKTIKRQSSLKINKKAPKGAKGVAKAKAIPILTGDAEVDYMAEQMCKAAGVKSNMSDDKKVKKIYHYMTTHFKHVHDLSKRTKYYNLSKLKTKIKKYRRSTDSKVKSGKMVYSCMEDYWLETAMVRRGGVCDHHALIFKVLCNHVGIEAGRCGGYYKNRNGSLSPHAWNYAVVGGKKYYYDVDVEIQNYKKGQGDYYWYKKTLSQAKKTHKFTEYSY